MLGYGTAEHYLLKVAPLKHQCFGRILMGYPHDVLLYYRTGVKLGRYVVARRTYNLNPSLPSLVVRPCAYEGRQERVVYIYNMVRVCRYHILADYLHVAGKH